MDAEKIKEELILISQHRLDRCKGLVSLALEQRELLTNRRHTELEDNARKHEQLIADLVKLDRREKTLLQELGRYQSDSSTTVAFNKRRSTVIAEIGAEAKKLKSLMQINAGLLGNAMNYINFTMGLLSRIVSNQPSYDPRGENLTSSAVVLDLRV
ncbi:MAG: flagellar export chaperone FlgN [Armatimonadota bacterium]